MNKKDKLCEDEDMYIKIHRSNSPYYPCSERVTAPDGDLKPPQFQQKRQVRFFSGITHHGERHGRHVVSERLYDGAERGEHRLALREK
jgi:hypothetical protein